MDYPVIYNYLDYRAFLSDMFCYRKLKNNNYSFRVFSTRAEFASPNFLKLVIQGKRNLTSNSLPQIAKGFSLKKKEREFFENLVFMNQAKTHEEKNYYYQKMTASKGYSQIHKIQKAGYEYFSKWYYPVIREVVIFGNRNLTAAQIAKLLNPSITPTQAENALETLQQLKLIQKDKNGCWQKKDKAITTGPEVKSLVIMNFHKEMLKLAIESLERHPAAKRDIGAVIMSISSESLPEIKERLAAFRTELLEFASNEEDSDQVIQISLQAFPLTHKHKTENE